MFWARPTREDEQNRLRLRQEALDGRAEFSDAVHQRLCETIRRCDVAPSPAADEPILIRRVSLGWPVAATAACLIVAATIGWQVFRNARNPRPPSDLPQVVRAPAVGSEPVPPSAEFRPVPAAHYPAPGEIVALVDSTMTSSQWAYLEHDAQVAWKLFAEAVPLRPTPRHASP
jgi:hypothetical protein